MTAYDSIERGAADECKPLTGRRPRTFTLTQLLAACGAVCVCAIGATTVVKTHLANFDDDSALANFDDGSAFDDDSALDDGSAFDDDSALDDGSAFDDDSALANFDDDYPEGAQLGQGNFTDGQKRCLEYYARKYESVVEAKCGSARRTGKSWIFKHCMKHRLPTFDGWYNRMKQGCTTPSPPPPPPPAPFGPYVRTVLPRGPLSRGSACYYPRGFYYRYSSRWKDCEDKCNHCGDCIGVFYNVRYRRCYFARGGYVWMAKPK